MELNFFRHYLVTLKYRANVAIEAAPTDYPNFEAGDGVRTPNELLSHISDVLTLGYSWFAEVERQKEVLEWTDEVDRFYKVIDMLDQGLVDGLPMNEKSTYAKLLHGPLADAMTHVGQLIMLRRLAGTPVRAKNYIKADIKVE